MGTHTVCIKGTVMKKTALDLRGPIKRINIHLWKRATLISVSTDARVQKHMGHMSITD